MEPSAMIPLVGKRWDGGNGTTPDTQSSCLSIAQGNSTHPYPHRFTTHTHFFANFQCTGSPTSIPDHTHSHWLMHIQTNLQSLIHLAHSLSPPLSLHTHTHTISPEPLLPRTRHTRRDEVYDHNRAIKNPIDKLCINIKTPSTVAASAK
ncbi:hypothetical protein GOP47_0011943 [Adiantum capillus-veneris]|uniref:Uncharacterized protein n=1 Tax=Adiantum capillus-veneris TaxID=13818 RepID=A0A9D4ZI58_ADICA|nr:hypothetical protein GOP47_0011943 [Adiantum capillus-veneris]